MHAIDEILMDLVPFMDKVMLSPMNEAEILKLEEIYQRRFPDYYRYYLRHIGFRQDFMWEALGNKEDFRDVSDFIGSDGYFQFANNGGEDYWLLKFGEEQQREVYHYDFYCDGEIKKLGIRFDELLENSLNYIKKNYNTRTLNTDKRWCVEFSVNTGNVSFFLRELEKYIAVRLLDDPSAARSKDSPSDEIAGIVEIAGETVALKRIRVTGSSSLYFNWTEPLKPKNEVMLTDQLEAALKKCIFKYNKCQFGIMTLEAINYQQS